MSRIINCSSAIREGLIEVAKKDSSVIFLAEGIEDPSSVYGTTKDLNKFINSNRIIEMPLSENSLTGVAIGSAMMGKKPVLSFHRVEFALLAIEQIFNNAAKAHYVSAGKHKVPIVMRLVIGRGWGQGPEHSQSLESLFAMIPGLKVFMPTYPKDAKGMIIAAIKDNNPVIFIEHRWCHYVEGNVPKGYYLSQIDRPKKVKKGKDLTIVASSYCVLEAVEAAEQLKKIGISASVFDLRVLRPLNLKEIITNVNITGRLITVDTGFKKYGIGSEIVSEVVSKCFNKLKIAPVKLGMPDHPVPSSRGYLKDLYPDASMIIKTALTMLKISNNNLSQLLKNIKVNKKNIPIDVPDPKFKGPF